MVFVREFLKVTLFSNLANLCYKKVGLFQDISWNPKRKTTEDIENRQNIWIEKVGEINKNVENSETFSMKAADYMQ